MALRLGSHGLGLLHELRRLALRLGVGLLDERCRVALRCRAGGLGLPDERGRLALRLGAVGVSLCDELRRPTLRFGPVGGGPLDEGQRLFALLGGHGRELGRPRLGLLDQLGGPTGGLVPDAAGVAWWCGVDANDRAVGRRRGARIGAVGATGGAGEQRKDGETGWA